LAVAYYNIYLYYVIFCSMLAHHIVYKFIDEFKISLQIYSNLELVFSKYIMK